MRWLADVNFLVALCYDAHSHHRRAIQWLKTLGAPDQIVLCRITQLGLLRLLNNPSIMGEDAQSCAQCWKMYDAILSDDRFVYLDEAQGLEREMRAMMVGEKFTPKLWQDAYLLAFAKTSGLKLLTFDKALDSRDISLVVKL